MEGGDRERAVRFRALARDLARGLSRREALRQLGRGFAGSVIAALGFGARAAEAQSPCPPGQAVCGAIAVICCPPGASCVNGACVCPNNQPPCGGPAGPCCSPGQFCVSGQCSVCPAGQLLCTGSKGSHCCLDRDTCCEGNCCAPGQEGVNGACACPPERLCGGQCCPEGQVCCNGACCPSQRCCNGVCCPEGAGCVHGQCLCATEDPQGNPKLVPPCSGVCCEGVDDVCCGGACCPSRRCCNGVCCPEGAGCVRGQCMCAVVGVNGQITLAPPCGGRCCEGINNVCGGGSCCPEGAICREGQCLCLPAGPSGAFTAPCGDACCSAGAVCHNNHCVCPPSGLEGESAPPCNGVCCQGATDVCCDGVCCPSERCCHDSCCAEGMACLSGVCISLSTESAAVHFCRGVQQFDAGPVEECLSQIAHQRGPFYELFVVSDGNPSDCCRNSRGRLLCCDPSVIPPLTCCDGVGCVGLQYNVNNCGACGHACTFPLGTGTGPVAGAAALTGSGPGPVGFFPGACCSGVCVDTRVNPQNCGDCGTVCPSGQCAASQCACQSLCDCPPNQFCSQGQCVSCVAGLTFCCATGTCADLSSDSRNCGSCGNACPPHTGCCHGACCPAGQLCCRGQCVDPTSDPNNCGTCSHVCSSGVCCPPTGPVAFPQCLNEGPLARFNCGNCGNSCPGGSDCCGGACIDLSSDPNNCGACGNHCPGGCCHGKCFLECPGDFPVFCCEPDYPAYCCQNGCAPGGVCSF